MTNQSEGRKLFAEMMSRQEDEIFLTEAALVLAKEVEYPDLYVDEYLGKIDLMVNEIKERVRDKTDPYSLINEINGHLFAEEGFRGNENDYYDPKNSFLNDVLDRKTGIPITLSVLYMEVAGGLNLRLSGVGFPGHFIVKYAGMREEVFIAPFNKGKILSEKDCREMLNRTYGEGAWFQREFLQAVTKKRILARMLHNLKGIYLNSGNHHKALSVTDMILLINPGAVNELRDRGLLYYRLECFAQALSDLETYLKYAPDAEDAGTIKSYIPMLRESAGKVN